MNFSHNDTNFLFQPGRLTTCLDGGAGSSGKGKLGAFITAHADNWQFCCNAFAPQAGHWVRNDDGSEYFYQTFNSCAYQPHYEKMYIGPGGIIELAAFWKELEANNLNPKRVGISPMAAILQEKDASFERGETDLNGSPLPTRSDGTMKRGSTCHGVGAALARRRLRRPDTLLARDIPDLKEFICDVPNEIMARLDAGQAGLLEIAQGYQLSYLLPEMYPYSTSRNCTVAAAMDDMMLPTVYAGNVVINFRTYPIRISNYKYISETHATINDNGKSVEILPGAHLTWSQLQEFQKAGLRYTRYEGNSGPGYADQEETTWDKITADSGATSPILEYTSVTKLPRRVYTFSKTNLQEAIKHNRTGGDIHIAVNFVNYLDHRISGLRGYGWESTSYGTDSYRTDSRYTDISKIYNWCRANVVNAQAKLTFLGTGPRTNDYLLV